MGVGGGNPVAADRGHGNRLAHAYFAINPDYLWQTIEEDLVPLIARVRVLLDESPGA
jgi:uncharacterized protein with HEPN domain